MGSKKKVLPNEICFDYEMCIYIKKNLDKQIATGYDS
jgi:hypothetical protein